MKVLWCFALSLDEYFRSSYYANITREVAVFAKRISDGAKNKAEIAVKIFNFIRDLKFGASPIYRASQVLEHLDKPLICASKAALQVACYRALGIPSRFYVWKVRVSDRTVQKINELLFTNSKRKFRSNLLLYHVAAEVFIERWVISDATIDKSLCSVFRISSWDGKSDVFMDGFDYLEDLGSFKDIPEFVVKLNKGSFLPFYLRPFRSLIIKSFNKKLNLLFDRLRDISKNIGC